jgi:hypothetical protein
MALDSRKNYFPRSDSLLLAAFPWVTDVVTEPSLSVRFAEDSLCKVIKPSPIYVPVVTFKNRN